MAELTTQERLQPSLLDRLTDDEPGKQEESREKRVISATRLRDCVTRDISWLLNCASMDADADLTDCPDVSRSVLNFEVLQRRVRDAILAFEPRLTGDTLRVTANALSKRMDRQALIFNIESEMWAQPIPLNLYLKTEVDLETGNFKVSEGLG